MIKITILLLIVILIVIVAVVLLFQEEKTSFKNTLTGIILLEENPVFNTAMIERDLLNRFKMRVKKKNSNEGIVILTLEKYKVVIVAVDAEIPQDELETVCKISHVWENALEKASKHESHIILSVSSDEPDLVELNLQFTRIAATLLRNTKSIGIYLGNQSLISPKDYYLKIADSANKDDLPLGNWIYFGLRENNAKRNGFTIGLKEFGYREIEIADSDKTFEEIYKILFDLAHHVLFSKEPLKQGETFNLSETEKISLEERIGEFRDTESMHVIVTKDIKASNKKS